MKALCVENLCKEYPSFRLHDVSFSVVSRTSASKIRKRL